MSNVDFLKNTIKNTAVEVFTINGYKMTGVVAKVLDEMIVLRNFDEVKCIMFGAISTIVPKDVSAFEKSMNKLD